MLKPPNRKNVHYMIIGVDIDDTSGGYIAAFRKSVGAHHGFEEAEHLTHLPDPTDYHFSSWKSIIGEDFRTYHGRAVEEGIYATMDVFPDASKYLWKLHEDGHRIVFITSRFVNHRQHARVITDTAIWLDKHDLPYDDIMFLRDKHIVQADVFVDDSPSKVEALRAAGREVIVFDASYNQDLEGPRAHNWEEAYNLITELAKKQAA